MTSGDACSTSHPQRRRKSSRSWTRVDSATRTRTHQGWACTEAHFYAQTSSPPPGRRALSLSVFFEQPQRALAIRYAELVEDRGDMRAHGSLGNEEPRRHLGRRVALPDEIENLPLAAGQVDRATRRELGTTAAAPLAELVDQAGDEPSR